MPKDVCKRRLLAFDFFFARNSFAGLVAYRAAGFASGLTGASALAASGHFLVCGFCDGLNHNVLLCGVVIFDSSIIIHFFVNCK